MPGVLAFSVFGVVSMTLDPSQSHEALRPGRPAPPPVPPVEDAQRTASFAGTDATRTYQPGPDALPPDEARWPVVPGYSVEALLGRGGMGSSTRAPMRANLVSRKFVSMKRETRVWQEGVRCWLSVSRPTISLWDKAIAPG